MTRAALSLIAFSLCMGVALADDAKIYATKEIVGFEQVQGQAQWIPNIQRRIRGATWTFYGNGKFRYSPADSRDDLFPLYGEYGCSGALCRFRAQASSRTGYTGSASVLIEGTLDFRGSEPVLQMYQINNSGSAAVINGTSFSQANTSSYRFTVTLTSP